MRTRCYLIVSEKGRIRTLKTRPRLEWDEVAIELSIHVPPALFTRPQIRASVDFGELEATTVDAEVLDNIEQAIQREAGVVVRVEVVAVDLEAD